MRLHSAIFLFIACSAAYCQQQPRSLVEACRVVHDSIVEVRSEKSAGTGFIVGPDGWILTAMHVVADRADLKKFENLRVSVIGSSNPFSAELVSPLDRIAAARDVAVLKIDAAGLPALDIGSEIGLEDGSPIAIIGLPLSASGVITRGSIVPFCLSGTLAAQVAAPLRGLDFLRIIYFQGVSIKGLSGAPVLSLPTGKVVGIVTTKLTGVGPELQRIEDNLDRANIGERNAGVEFRLEAHGIDAAESVGELIRVLDEQLANGLGSASGASDASFYVHQAKRDFKSRVRGR